MRRRQVIKSLLSVTALPIIAGLKPLLAAPLLSLTPTILADLKPLYDAHLGQWLYSHKTFQTSELQQFQTWLLQTELLDDSSKRPTGQALLQRSRADFNNGSIIEADGWQISQSEALLHTLMYSHTH